MALCYARGGVDSVDCVKHTGEATKQNIAATTPRLILFTRKLGEIVIVKRLRDEFCNFVIFRQNRGIDSSEALTPSASRSA